MTLLEHRLRSEFDPQNIVMTRHAAHALERRGIGLVEVMGMLRASDFVRRDPKSGHFVLRHGDFRIVVDLEEKTKTAKILTVFWGDMQE